MGLMLGTPARSQIASYRAWRARSVSIAASNSSRSNVFVGGDGGGRGGGDCGREGGGEGADGGGLRRSITLGMGGEGER
jgi:hypothetical protein